MRILHVEAGRHLYGGARQAGLLIAELERRGIDNRLVCPPGQPLLADLPAHVRAPVPIRGEPDPLFPWRLKRKVLAFRPDVLHVHSRRGADWAAAVVSAVTAVPAVLTRRVESREWTPWLNLKARAYRAVVSISSAVDRELLAAGLEPSRLVRIPSAVNSAVWAPDPEARHRLRAEFDLPDGAPVVASVAQLISRKGVDTVIDAVAMLAESRPDLRLVCFGQGPDRASLEHRAARSGLAGRVRFAGFRRDLPALLPGADVVVHAPVREGLGVAVLEAMGAARPVVATAAGGIPDLLRSDREGLLVPPARADALAGSLGLLIENPAFAARLGEAARRRVLEDFSVGRMADSYLNVYSGMMEAESAVFRY